MKVLMAQLDYILGNFEYNTKKMLDVISKHGNDTDVIVFSELCFTGYYPKDYLQRIGFIDIQDEYMRKVQAATRGIRASVVVGFADRNPFIGKPLFNALAVFDNGEIAHIYRKILLCDYNIFNEPRHFESGNKPGLITLKGKRIGFLICEDAWNEKDSPVYTTDPVARLERELLDLIISINGSPSNVGKQEQRYHVISGVAKRCNAPVVYVNQVGGYDDIIFDGASFAVARDGSVSYSLESFVESCSALELTDCGAWASTTIGKSIPSPKVISENELKYQQPIVGIRDYMAKCGFTQAVIGLSGGIDSAAVAMLAAMAIGSENVTCILMPNFPISSQGSVDDALKFCENFGVKHYVYPIGNAFNAYVDMHVSVYGEKPSNLAMENWQARERGKILMEYSNNNPSSIVLATGNKSETSVGYCTTFGDMCGGLNPIGDLYKTDVRDICYYHNNKNPQMLIPEVIITKGPSAELSLGQMDTDSLPPYEILDPILKLYIEAYAMTEEERAVCIKALAMTSTSVVGRVLRMVDRSEYKRQLSTVILRVRQIAFGDGRQFPITGQYFDEQICKKILGRFSGGAV